MTARERAKEATWEVVCPDWGTKDQEQLEMAVEQAINAAVEEDRKTRPHMFIGRTDRDCELCGEPDRDEIHCYSREVSRRFVGRAVEEEREACRKIAASWMRLYDPFTDPRSRVALEISEAIAARSNPAE